MLCILIWSIQGQIYVIFCHRLEGGGLSNGGLLVLLYKAVTSYNTVFSPLKLSTAKLGLVHILGNSHSLMVISKKK